MSGKLSLFHLKMYEFAVYEKLSFKKLGFSCSSNLDQASYIDAIAKTAFKKIGKIDLFFEVFFFWSCILFL